MTTLTRRHALSLGAATFITGILAGRTIVEAAESDTLTIAYNVNLPSFDPTTGPSAVNPTIQAIYRCVFDPYIDQNPDLSFKPGILTEWGWSEDRTKAHMTVREGAFWHDGTPVTPEDVIWSLQRAGKEETGNPIQFIWSTLGNFSVSGNTITADVVRFEPTIFKWMGFLTGYMMPMHALAAGADDFVMKPYDRATLRSKLVELGQPV